MIYPESRFVYLAECGGDYKVGRSHRIEDYPVILKTKIRADDTAYLRTKGLVVLQVNLTPEDRERLHRVSRILHFRTASEMLRKLGEEKVSEVALHINRPLHKYPVVCTKT